jgi:hypothetical protein
VSWGYQHAVIAAYSLVRGYMNAWHTQICVEISRRRSCDREMREYGHVLILSWNLVVRSLIVPTNDLLMQHNNTGFCNGVSTMCLSVT